jgi:predicted transcriptional regulator
LRWRQECSGRRITDFRGENIAALEKPQTSITPALRAELAVRYEAGATIRELAVWSGAHRQTVVRHLVRKGVKLRRSGLTDEQAKAAERLYLEGMALVEIAAEFGVAASTIRSCALRLYATVTLPMTLVTTRWTSARGGDVIPEAASRARSRPDHEENAQRDALGKISAALGHVGVEKPAED